MRTVTQKNGSAVIPAAILAPAAVACGLLAAGCSTSPGTSGPAGNPEPPPQNQIDCSIPESQIFSGGVDRGQIPELTNPELVPAGDPDADYLLDSDRVIGLQLAGEWIAVPHNILWWHEVINFDRIEPAGSGERIVVTYCPLTGSSLVFDRSMTERFEVSGLLFNNNLMMVDVETESLWPQMSRGARCGPSNGIELVALPSIETTWEGWLARHPDTKVVSGATGFSRDYTQYPYGNYEDTNEPPFVQVPEPDTRRAPKERVLGIPASRGPSLAVPFFELASVGGPAAVREGVAGDDIVVLWDDESQTAAAYRPEVDGQLLTFEVTGGVYRDQETGSVWDIEGVAVSGPLAGSRLERIPESYVAFWFAWSTFEPHSRIWRPR